MEKVEIIDEPARRADPHFDLEDYILTHVSMFSGEESDVVLRCDKSLVNAVMDRFGMGVRIVPANDGESFTVYAPVVAKEPFFGWVFQFGGQGRDNRTGEYPQRVPRNAGQSPRRRRGGLTEFRAHS